MMKINQPSSINPDVVRHYPSRSITIKKYGKDKKISAIRQHKQV